MADRYEDTRAAQSSRDTNQSDYGRGRDDQRSDYGYGRAGGSGYGNDRDTRAGYSGYEGRDYKDRYTNRGDADRAVPGDGAQGRNWAERAGDEVRSWVGDDEAERRRQQDEQKIGRYPGDDRGQDGYRSGGDQSDRGTYGQQFGEPGYGQSGDFGSARYAQGQGYGSRSVPTSGFAQSGYRRDQVSGAYRAPTTGSYGVPASNDPMSRQRSDEDGGRSSFGRDNRGQDGRSQGRDNWASNTANYSSDDRGFFDKAADEVKSWFGDDDAERRRDSDSQRSDARSAFGGADRGPDRQQSLGYTGKTAAHGTTHHDPDYLSYRNARIDEFDRDYHEYKQTKQKQFHDDFHEFRTQRSSATKTDATGIGTASGSMGATSAAMGVGAGITAASPSALGTVGQGASPFAGSTQGGMASKIREHMVVDGSDGQGVGKVDHVLGQDIKLTKHDSTDGKHHLIPLSWVVSVEGDKVKLSKTSEQAMREWRVADPAPGAGTIGAKA